MCMIASVHMSQAGTITVDDEALSALNVHWWRGHIGYVGQQVVRVARARHCAHARISR
jgi:ABC-type proline/glycine betaine transport system ATPase subunit